VRHHTSQLFLCTVIARYNNQFVFSARQLDAPVSSYICQLQQGLSVMSLILLECRYLCHPRYVTGVLCSFFIDALFTSGLLISHRPTAWQYVPRQLVYQYAWVQGLPRKIDSNSSPIPRVTFTEDQKCEICPRFRPSQIRVTFVSKWSNLSKIQNISLEAPMIVLHSPQIWYSSVPLACI